jgi:cytochrome c-type biogenesis protein CcmH/NrfF
MVRTPILLLLILTPALPAATPAVAQIPAGVEGLYEPHPEARKAISRLLSPYCPGFMLEVCPSAEAQALRDSIHGRALAGADADELVGWMLAIYGNEYLAVPPSRGFGLLAWLFPPLALLLGALGVVMALRRFRPSEADETTGAPDGEPGTGAPATGDVLPPEVESRLREAIRELELSEDPL